MKYTIEGFSQEYAISLRKMIFKRNKNVEIKIDCTDLVILRWFVDFYPNMKKIIVDGREYAWLTHKKLLEDLPLIDISKNAFIERMQKLVTFEVLDYKFIKDGGTFSLYTFGKNYENLISKGICSNKYGVHAQTGTGVCVQTDTKDNTINNNTIDYKHIVDYLNEKAVCSYKPTTPKTQQLIRARANEGFTEDDFKRVIDNKVAEWKGTDMEKYLRPETLFGTQFEGYLNTKQQTHRERNGVRERSYSKDELNNMYTNIDDIQF